MLSRAGTSGIFGGCAVWVRPPLHLPYSAMDSLLTCILSGYLLDLLIAQAFGLVLSPLEQEFGFNSTLSVDESWRCAQ